MRRLGLGQVAEQLADRRVGAALGGLQIEAVGVGLHLLGLGAHRLYALGRDLARRLRAGRAADLAPGDVGQVPAEALAVEVDQGAAMLVLLRGHVVKEARGGGIVGAQVLGEVGVDAPVLLLAGHRQRQELLLAQIVEPAQT